MQESPFEEFRNKLETSPPANIILIALLVIGLGGFIGATTNLLNGQISEEYFRVIMGWDFSGIWMVAIIQGLLEGILYGLIFSLIYTIGYASITKVQGSWKFVRKQLFRVLCLVYIHWIIGGIIAMILMAIYPEGWDEAILGLPETMGERMRFAWVAGSIWGGMIGGIIAIIVGLIKTHTDWQNLNRR